MNKIEMLFIRACKSYEPSIRVTSVYHRFYGDYGSTQNTIALCSILSELCTKYGLITVSRLTNNVLSLHLRGQHPKPMQNLLLSTFIEAIRFTNVDTLPKDFIHKNKFRK